MLLVKFNHNCYDEYTLNGFALYPNKETFEADFATYFEENFDNYDGGLFGLTNDCEYSNAEEFLNDFTFTEIYLQHYEVLIDLFPEGYFGFFPF